MTPSTETTAPLAGAISRVITTMLSAPALLAERDALLARLTAAEAQRDALAAALERIGFGSPYTAKELRDIARTALAALEKEGK